MRYNTKSLLKEICRYVYYAGAGNCWYEDTYQEQTLYKIYKVTSFAIYSIMIILENMAALFGDFPEMEKNSAVMFSAIHNIVLVKMFLLLYNQKSIKTLNYEMATVGECYEEANVMNKQQRKVKFGIALYAISVYLSLFAYGIESVRKSIVEGTPFYTVVTYLPYYENSSVFASFFRIFFYVTWLYMMLPMMSADCMPITHLIILAYKFVTLCRHFEIIRTDFDANLFRMSKKEAYDKLKAGCLEGIKIHQKLIFLAAEINRVFGIIMSLQVCESSAVAVLLLMRLALSPHLDLTNAFMTYTFVGSLFLLLALNLWNAGEITYQPCGSDRVQLYRPIEPRVVGGDKDTVIALDLTDVEASLLSNAMFNCGWHICELEKEHYRDIRKLVLVGCAQAQKPLILKAFGIQDLSYETFVSVARTTYSVFAVFYHKGERVE